MSTREKQFTSTVNKLLHHHQAMDDIIKFKKWYPINLQIAPTNLCNLNCEFCSVKNRGNEVLDYVSLTSAIRNFDMDINVKSVEITGGGEPTLYPRINELIDFCDKQDYKIGLITNGVALDKIKQINLDKLTWLRISLSAFDFGKELDIPAIQGTLGFSYVWHEKSHETILDKIYNYTIKHNVRYVRIVPDCLDIKKQDILKYKVARLILSKGYEDKLFVQTKAYDVHPKCYIGRLKPFINADGYVYQCSATALYARKFTAKWRICHMKDILKHWPDKFKDMDTSICEKGKCFYSEQNKLLDDLQIEAPHHGFI